MNYEKQYQEYLTAIEKYLSGLFQTEESYGRLQEAMRYSVLSGGKRIRPVLTLEMARQGGIDWHLALPYACALELVHTYSLIHDDLPCMDDDDLRRGKPTNHKVYGETLAILAGDALQSAAFRLLAGAPMMSYDNRIEAVGLLARACGEEGMVAGQVLDTLCDVKTAEGLTQLNRLKTGVMISAAAELGCVASQMQGEQRRQALQYASDIGVGFQIQDDILDVVGNEEIFGKPIGSDRQEGKVTFVDVLGFDACRNRVAACTESAKKALENWPDHDFLWELADRMANRNK